MKQHAAAIALLAIATSALCAPGDEPLALKGFRLGQPMDQCPAEATKAMPNRDGTTMCMLGPTTFANQTASLHAISIADGKIVNVVIALTDKGPYANGPVLEALREKFGSPTLAKAHLNDYVWQRGSQVLSLDGYRGMVLLSDLQDAGQRANSTAKKNKGDL